MCWCLKQLGDVECNLHCIGNELSQVEGLEGVQQLMELVLDRNKIKVTCDVIYIKGSYSYTHQIL